MQDKDAQGRVLNPEESESRELTPSALKLLAEEFVSASISVEMKEALILKEAHSIGGDDGGSK